MFRRRVGFNPDWALFGKNVGPLHKFPDIIVKKS